MKISKEGIAKVAEKVAKKFKFNPLSEKEDDLDELVKKLGGTIEEVKSNKIGSYNSRIEGSFKEKKFTIYVVEGMHEEEERLCIAHEIGHYILHSMLEGGQHIEEYNHGFFTDEQPIQELEANEFANNLLMPKKDFKKKAEELKRRSDEIDIIGELARIFKVDYYKSLERDEDLFEKQGAY